MQSLGRVLAQGGDGWRPIYPYWQQTTSRQSKSGIFVSPERALTSDAVYACVTIISEDIGKLPFGVYENLGELGSRPAPNHPIEDLLQHQPNSWQTAIEFREMLTAFAMLRQFGIAEIVPGPRGPVDQLIPLHPDLVLERMQDGQRVYRYYDPMRQFEERILLPDEVLVLRGKLGRPILDFARETIGATIGADEFQQQMFGRGAAISGVVSHPRVLDDPLRTAIRAGLDEYVISGPRAGRPLLLEDGMTWQNATFSPADMQALEALKWGLLKTGRYFRVSPSKLMDFSQAHYNNVEAENLNHATDTLMPWAIRWEQATYRDLIVAKGRYFTRIDLDEVQRGDIESRYTAYSLAIMAGWMVRNDARRKEHMNPLAGLDEPIRALNLGTEAQADTHAQNGTNRQEPAVPGNPNRKAVRGQLSLLAADVAGRIQRREQQAVAKLRERTGDGDAFHAGAEEFYAEHERFVADALHIPRQEANRYAGRQLRALLSGDPSWEGDRIPELVNLALDQIEEIR